MRAPDPRWNSSRGTDLERERIVTGTTAAIFDTFKNYKIFLEDAKSRLSQEPASSADEEDDGDEEESGP